MTTPTSTTTGCSLLLVFCFVAIAGCHTPDPAAPFLHTGRAALAEGSWSTAIESFDETLRLNPECLEALLGLATAREGLGDLSSAATDYERVLKVDPENVHSRKRLVLLLLELDEGSKAHGQLSALEGKIADFDFHLIQGRVELLLGKANEAVVQFDQALALDPGNTLAWYLRGNALASSGNNVAAEDSFTKAIAADRQNAIAYWQRAVVRTKLNKKDLAELDQVTAAELDPRLSFAESSVGKTMLERLQGDSDGLQALRGSAP
ncbi:tetratricopeptide repeat protein [Anatilimnocola sp. NA78]|uniref:tetratricopeptide repeat protein n=1 Tax=Anatilimnocola sp. NA78 TaxID=3415683 RepID=UPI003CE54577